MRHGPTLRNNVPIVRPSWRPGLARLLRNGLPALALGATLATAANAQTLEWQQITASPLRPAGMDYSYSAITNSYSGTARGTSIPQTAAESGNDWWFNLTTLKDDNGAAIGYITVGYSGTQNWGFTDGCYTSGISGNPDPVFFETYDHRGSRTRGAVARYDLNGQLIWHRSFYVGLLTGVVQDAAGDIVVCGQAWNSTGGFFDDITHTEPLLLNATMGSTDVLPGTNCVGAGAGQMVVMKLDVNGDLIWNHLFNPETDPTLAIKRRSSGYDLVETDHDGTLGYRIVGDAAWDNGNGTYNDQRLKPWFVQLDHDGFIQWEQHLPTVSGYWGVSDYKTLCWAIDRTQDPVTHAEHYVVSGLSDHGATTRAWMMYFDEPATSAAYVPYTWVKETTVDGTDFPLVQSAKRQLSTDVEFLIEGGAEKIIWPVTGNVTGSWWAGNHFAENGLIYKLDAATGSTELEHNLGELHAFDLHLGVSVTSGGDVFATCTKWPGDRSMSGTHYGQADLNGAQQTCQTNTSSVQDWTVADQFYLYWGSQSYLIKLNGSDLQEQWHHQWTHGYTAADDCFPGNVRRRQCNFSVVEAPDGGAVICGNTGHNFDDAYLAKVNASCEGLTPIVEGHVTHPCDAATTGSIDLSVTGTGPFTYVWSNGATTQDLSNVPPGMYDVKVYDAAAPWCMGYGLYEVYAPLDFTLAHRPPCLGSPHLGVEASGGSGNYTIWWNHCFGCGQHEGETFTPPFNGVWYPSIEDLETGCLLSLPSQDWPLLDVDPPLEASATITLPDCHTAASGAIDLTIANTDYGTITYLWSTGATTEDITGLVPGTYTVTVSYGTSCSRQLTYTVPNECTTQWSMTTMTDGAGSEITWEIIDRATSLTVASGGGAYGNNTTVTVPVLLPIGCFDLKVHDSGSNGITGGGYVLRDYNDDPQIDNTNNGGTFTSLSQSQNGFCNLVGADHLRDFDCGNLERLSSQWIQAQPNAAVTAEWGVGDQTNDGYDFWFTDPNGSYSRVVSRRHSNAGGGFPADATRSSKLYMNSWATNPLPSYTLLNVRVRSVVNGVASAYGPACRIKIDPEAAYCPTTRLTDANSGITGLHRNGTSHISAKPAVRQPGTVSANKYRFHFENPADATAFNIVQSSYPLTITAVMPFVNGATYNVTVQASFDGGVTWCPPGETCQISISPNGMAQQPITNDIGLTSMVDVHVFPNPNRGDRLFIHTTGVDLSGPVHVDITDLSGKLITTDVLVVPEGGSTAEVTLGEQLANGLYLVTLVAGEERFARRLVVQH